MKETFVEESQYWSTPWDKIIYCWPDNTLSSETSMGENLPLSVDEPNYIHIHLREYLEMCNIS
jgi:hypothetical protein